MGRKVRRNKTFGLSKWKKTKRIMTYDEVKEKEKRVMIL